MHARFATGQVQPDKLDEVIRITRDSVIPAMQQQPGNRGATLGVDRQAAKFSFGSYWDTAADRDRTGEGSSYLNEQIAKIMPLLAGPLTVENHEVSILEGQREGSYIRLSTAKVRPEKVSHVVSLLRDVAPNVRQQPGNTAALVLTDAQTGTIRVGTVWATEADRAAFQSSGIPDKVRSQLTDLVAEPMPPAEQFEVVARV